MYILKAFADSHSNLCVTISNADLHILDLNSNKETTIKIGVSDIPFDTDDIDDEGLDIILGIDFIQETKLFQI